MGEGVERIVEVFTDGACSGNPGPGGWGAILRYGKHEREIYGSDPATTNNRMELLAVIRALESLTRPSRVRVYSDSRYVVDGVTLSLSMWRANGWLTKSKKAVKNVDLWERLAELSDRHDIEWRWVRGHDGHADNERADRLAVRGAEEAKRMERSPTTSSALPYHPGDLFGVGGTPEAVVPSLAEPPETDELCRHELPLGQCDYCRALPPGVLARGFRTAGGRAYHNDPDCEWLRAGQQQSERAGHNLNDIVPVAWQAVDPTELQPCEWCCTPQWLAHRRRP
ncbi:ribonuclease HI [Nocardia sp. AG03]|uniref:ribonuclease HI n=1 Tax=Nocardia sp. AG03 TaxID=3025312 RepID=UPI00325BFA6D